MKRSSEIENVNVKLGLKARQVINNKIMPQHPKKNGTNNSICYLGAALSGLGLNINPLAQGFVSLHPGLLH